VAVESLTKKGIKMTNLQDPEYDITIKDIHDVLEEARKRNV